MSLRNHSLREVLASTFSRKIWAELLPATLDTLYMVIFAAAIMFIFGIILGIILYITRKDGIFPMKWFNKIVGTIINCLRSLPEMIMIIVTLPLARALLGKGYGANACIVALAASCIPMFARMVESALLELSKGKIEAAKAMDSSVGQIIFYVIIPESRASIVRAFTTALIAIVSMTALAGNFGAGGIGDIAVRFGFNRFQHDMLFATILVLIIIVQSIQFLGDKVSNILLKKWHLI